MAIDIGVVIKDTRVVSAKLEVTEGVVVELVEFDGVVTEVKIVEMDGGEELEVEDTSCAFAPNRT